MRCARALDRITISTRKVYDSFGKVQYTFTHLLNEERGALPPFLRLFDHEPLRFEDFEAQDRSSREACLAGVEAI